MKANYKLSIAGWSADSSDDARTELLELETASAIGSPASCCRVTVYAPPKPKPGLLEELAGAALGAVGLGGGAAPAAKGFSIEVRGQKVAYTDQVSITLTSGDKSGQVMTAEVRAIRSSFGDTIITGQCGGHRLVTTRLNQIYQNQSVSQIVKDLASQAGVTAGDIAQGSNYPYYVVHESRNLWSHIRDLAARDGLDVYFDERNALTVKKFDKTTADHTLYYGIDVLDIELLNVEPASEHVFVYPESSSSNTGSDTWHWLAKDPKPVRGEVGKGAKTLGLSDGAVRTKDTAGTFAAAKLGAIQDGSTLGRLRLLGNPQVKVASAIEIKNSPTVELNGVFKVTSVRHVYNKREGFVTIAGFSGKGGTAAAGGLGELAGALAGAIGL